MSDITNTKSRAWCSVLYPDDPSHEKCIELLKSNGYTFAGILHDSDTWSASDDDIESHDVGTLKKKHYHLVIYFRNPKYRNALAKELGITPNYLRECRNRDASILYLVHANDPDKFQYDSSLVFGTMAENLKVLLTSGSDEGDRVKSIVQMIDSIPGICSYKQILLMACDNGLYGEFRRLGSGVKWLLDEHNNDFITEEQACHGLAVSHDDFRDMMRWHQRIKESEKHKF